jgi:hypothetical protein
MQNLVVLAFALTVNFAPTPSQPALVSQQFQLVPTEAIFKKIPPGLNVSRCGEYLLSQTHGVIFILRRTGIIEPRAVLWSDMDRVRIGENQRVPTLTIIDLPLGPKIFLQFGAADYKKASHCLPLWLRA